MRCFTLWTACVVMPSHERERRASEACEKHSHAGSPSARRVANAIEDLPAADGKCARFISFQGYRLRTGLLGCSTGAGKSTINSASAIDSLPTEIMVFDRFGSGPATRARSP